MSALIGVEEAIHGGTAGLRCRVFVESNAFVFHRRHLVRHQRVPLGGAGRVEMRAVGQIKEAEHGDTGRRRIERGVSMQADAFVGQIAPGRRQIRRLGAAGSEGVRALECPGDALLCCLPCAEFIRSLIIGIYYGVGD